MGITPSEWELVTPYYFMMRVTGMRKKETQIYQSEMEKTRWMVCKLLTPNLKKSTSSDPKKLFPFSWDKVSVFEPVDLVNFVTKNKEIYDKLRL